MAYRKWFSIHNVAADGFAEIKLRGFIGAQKSYGEPFGDDPNAAGTLQEFEHELEEIGPVDRLQVSIFSHGGDWATGVAIHNLLMRHPAAEKVAVIDGLCASAATYPAMACGEIRIPENASILIHDASAGCYGRAQEMLDCAAHLEGISNNIAGLYAKRSGKSIEEIRALMGRERYLTGAEAVDLGLADTLVAPLANLAQRSGSLDPTNAAGLEKAPAHVLSLFDMARFSHRPAHNHAAPFPSLLATMNNTPTPAPAPAAPVDPAPAAPQNVDPAPAPLVTEPASPVVEPASIPAEPVVSPLVNVSPDFAALIGTAVANAIKPLREELATLRQQQSAGISAVNLAGAPAANGQPVETATVTFENLTPLQCIAAGRVAINKAAPPAPVL